MATLSNTAPVDARSGGRMQAGAVGYIRVSTEEQAVGGVSLAAQRTAVEAYCTLHDLDIAHVFADEGLSGCRADNRPGLQAAVDAARRAKCVLERLQSERSVSSVTKAVRRIRCGDLIQHTLHR